MALLIASIVSFLVFYTGVNIGMASRDAFPAFKDTIDRFYPYLLFGLIGFTGIYTGVRLFPKSLRTRFSIILLITGVIFDAVFWILYTSWTHSVRDYSVLLLMSTSLIIGGLLVAVLEKRKNAA